MNEKITGWIHMQLENGKSWDDIMLANKQTTEGLEKFLSNRREEDYWPELSVEEWQELVKEEKQKEEAEAAIIDEKGATVIAAGNETNNLPIPLEENSAWQSYRRTLAEKGFSDVSIRMIEDGAIKTLRNLSRDTCEREAVKGLVVGNVQSGKTANMTALMAMAADHGWNMFIILSGMRNNLKDQTVRRVISDLEGSRWDWREVRDLRPAAQFGDRTIDRDWSDTSRQRNIAVCIKNVVRLKNLLNWLNEYSDAKERIRLLIIDDECDQASVNTARDEERTVINNLLLNLVNNRTVGNKKAATKAQAINYVAYTATPYANVLNEAETESLYPRDFITTLAVSDEYFGPEQIFGYEGDDAEAPAIYPGLDIVRNISDDDCSDIEDIHNGVPVVIPESFVAAIAWFLCGVAAMRVRKYRKPISMLVHTSRKRKHHNNISEAIRNWFLSTSKSEKIRICRRLWEDEGEKFTERDLFAGYPDYSRSSGRPEIVPNPSFDAIQRQLEVLIDEGVRNIEISSVDQHRTYSKGINLCVDNSDRNDDDRIQKRLMYPEERELPGYAPAFLVIGGDTLSRGLTLEGLISTCFIRPARCADTLMQMGRWFGYRRGYELLPRIWMPQNTKDQFVFIAEMDRRLRDEIRQMEEINVSPMDCGPKIMASPSTKFLQIVSANKMQAAIPSTYDFSGHTKETGVFSKDVEKLERNLRVTREFLSSLGHPDDTASNPYANGKHVWREIPWNRVRSYLTDYEYSERLRGFNETGPLLKWFDQMTEKGEIGNWNVILAGVQEADEESGWKVSEDVGVNKVERTQITPDRADGTMNIKVLRSFNDFLSDIPVRSDDFQLLDQMSNVKHTIFALNELRDRIGMSSTPQLVIYIIDKDSQPKPNSTMRYPLNSPRDIAGFSINIPGYKGNRSGITTWTIRPSRNQDSFV